MDNRVAAVLCAKERDKSLIKIFRVSLSATIFLLQFFCVEDVRNVIEVSTQLN
jgi:hypothetical protein